MNKQLEDFARSTIKLGLMKISADEFIIFKRMYSHNDLLKDIDSVVNEMPVEKLDWAMQQIERTITNVRKNS